ncbi:MAG: hypothetical protein EBU46_00100 [Nitrosomonadaceae bacterium]|nr:hypothetical protein [Nitrosomonadaceae bacterium]
MNNNLYCIWANKPMSSWYGSWGAYQDYSSCYITELHLTYNDLMGYRQLLNDEVATLMTIAGTKVTNDLSNEKIAREAAKAVEKAAEEKRKLKTKQEQFAALKKELGL